MESARNNFSRLVTIELNPPFIEAAKKKFKGWHNVELIEGDSGIVSE